LLGISVVRLQAARVPYPWCGGGDAILAGGSEEFLSAKHNIMAMPRRVITLKYTYLGTIFDNPSGLSESFVARYSALGGRGTRLYGLKAAAAAICCC
jgi:hypothetical protein